jgi:3-oxoacyl-[acyl-carrier protein] reductase
MTTTRIFGDRHKDAVFIVTGGGSGIGEAAGRRLAAEGAKVVIADVRVETAQRTADEIRAEGGEAIAIRCNVAVEDDVRGLVAAAIHRFGAISGLFANAGTAGAGWVHETNLADWNRVISVNLTGTFLCAKHVLPELVARGGGAIVTTGSIASVMIGAGGSAASYAASKGAILQLTKQIAVDYGAKGVRAACVCPGAVTTNLGQNAREDRLSDTTPQNEPLPRSRQRTPLPRAASPDEIGAVVSFLLSDEASFVTGSAVFADGGLTAI